MLISQSFSSEARAIMSPSLSSFLQTYPFKRKDCLEHVCETLKMSKNGTCDTLTARIIAYVDDNTETDAKVRDIAQRFKIGKSKTQDNSRHSIPPVASTPSQPLSQLLFPDTQSQPTPIKDITKEIDELDDMANELTLNCNTGEEKNESSLDENDADENISSGPYVQEKSEISFKKQMEFLIAESVKVIASKDHQIETLEKNIATLEKNLANVIEFSGKIIEKHDSDLKRMTEEGHLSQNKMAEFISEVVTERAERSRRESELAAKNDQLVTTITQLDNTIATISTELKNVNHKLTSLQNARTVPAAINVAQNVQDKLEKIATNSSKETNPFAVGQKNPTQTTPTPSTATSRSTSETISVKSSDKNAVQNDEVILVIADSNGKFLKPNLLHDKKKVIIETKYTWEETQCSIPLLDHPEKVTDIVMLTGINDVKNSHSNIPDVLKTADVTCRKYQESFPNSIIHLGSIAPADSKCMSYNMHLQELAAERGAPFISTDGMFNTSGNVKPDILHGIHYTRRGVCTIAKAVKKSLYNRPPRLPKPSISSTIPRGSPAVTPNQVSTMCQPSANQVSSTPNHALILETFCNIAKACLQNH